MQPALELDRAVQVKAGHELAAVARECIVVVAARERVEEGECVAGDARGVDADLVGAAPDERIRTQVPAKELQRLPQ